MRGVWACLLTLCRGERADSTERLLQQYGNMFVPERERETQRDEEREREREREQLKTDSLQAYAKQTP